MQRDAITDCKTAIGPGSRRRAFWGTLTYCCTAVATCQRQRPIRRRSWRHRTSWFAKHGAAIAGGGNPFTANGQETIGADGKVTDGAFAAANGYTLINSDSLDKAVEIAKCCPVLLGGAKVTVYETFDAMAAMAGSKP